MNASLESRAVERANEGVEMKSALSLTLIVCLAASAPAVFAQDLRSSIQRTAFEEAARQQHQTKLPMPKGFLWTGVGLLGYGGFLLWLGERYGDRLDCPRGDCSVCAPDHHDCPRSQDVLRSGAGISAASGVAVLVVGAVIGARRSPDLAPRVTLNRRGFAIQQPVPLGRRHAGAHE